MQAPRFYAMYFAMAPEGDQPGNEMARALAAREAMRAMKEQRAKRED